MSKALFFVLAYISTVIGLATHSSAQTPIAPTIDWSGFYLGAHGGYGWSRIETGIGNVHVDGWLGGGHVGLQGQFNRWVAGIEASYSAGELDGGRAIDIAGTPLRLDASISDLLLVTGRLGYAWSDKLAYVKAGYASADVEISATFLGVTTMSRSRLDGWTAGFGVERAVTPNIVVGLEYNYVDLGSASIAAPGPGVILAANVPAKAVVEEPEAPPAPPKPLRLDSDGLHTVFARLTFRFGGAPPVQHESYK